MKYFTLIKLLKKLQKFNLSKRNKWEFLFNATSKTLMLKTLILKKLKILIKKKTEFNTKQRVLTENHLRFVQICKDFNKCF